MNMASSLTIGRALPKIARLWRHVKWTASEGCMPLQTELPCCMCGQRRRRLSTNTGLVLGVYERGRTGPKSGTSEQTQQSLTLPANGTPSFLVYDQQLDGALTSVVQNAGHPLGTLKQGKCRVFHRHFPADNSDVDKANKIPNVFLVGLGRENSSVLDPFERINLRREHVREAVASGVRAARDYGITHVLIDTCHEEQAAAEAAHLQAFQFNDLKSKTASSKTSRNSPDEEPESLLPPLQIEPCITEESGEMIDIAHDIEKWRLGVLYAEAQNFARWLMEMPSNMMTPTMFAEHASNKIIEAGSNVHVIIHEQSHMEEMGMGALLAVARGSSEPPKFMEIIYKGARDAARPSTAFNPDLAARTADGDMEAAAPSEPVILIGKGVTFDAGGISIKPAASMDRMRGDMGGAAVVVASIWAAVKLQLPINIVGLIPLTENMPDGKAIKPGDVVRAMNGVSIQIDNTDAEGRLILADALCYACEKYPSNQLIIDLATLTGAMDVALGKGAAGVFATCSRAYQDLESASAATGDRVWRMPLFQLYQRQMRSRLADINNVSAAGRGGAGACTAAAFLRKFVSPQKTARWMHIDIAGVMDNGDEVPYLGKGMSGRPTRTIIEFLRNYQGRKGNDAGNYAGGSGEPVGTRQPRPPLEASRHSDAASDQG